MEIFVATFAAAMMSLIVARLADHFGPIWGLVDHPDKELKPHAQPIVPLGGLGVVTGFAVGWIIAGGVRLTSLVAVIGVALLGLMDDLVPLPPRMRLFVEVLAGMVLVVGPFAMGEISAVTTLFGVLASVVMVNAVNLYDGIDGLATASAAAGLVTAWGFAAPSTATVAAIGAAALLGFLPLNWNPARMFLGDNGSYAIGLILVAVALESAIEAKGLAWFVVAAVGGTVFAVDLAVTLFRRAYTGVSLFKGDRSHVYDQLLYRGWSVRRIAAVSATVNGAIGVVVWTVAKVNPVWGAVITVAMVIALVYGLIRCGFVKPD